jgi:hypothetical protein
METPKSKPFEFNTELCNTEHEHTIKLFAHMIANIIHISARDTCNDNGYFIEINNQSALFEKHPIIRDTRILFDVMYDATHQTSQSVYIQHSINENNLSIILVINSKYINDTLTLELPQEFDDYESIPEKDMTLDALKDELNNLTENVNCRLDEHDDQLNDLEDVNDDIADINYSIDDLDIRTENLIDQVNSLKTLSKLRPLNDSPEIYKDLQVLHLIHKSAFNNNVAKIWNENICYRHWDTRSIIIEPPQCDYHIHFHDNELRRWINFNPIIFLHLKKLKHIILQNIPIENLDFLKSFDTLESISLIDIPSLKYICALRNFTSLKYIQITRCNNVIDLKTLFECPELTNLVLTIGMNVDGFSEHKNINVTQYQPDITTKNDVLDKYIAGLSLDQKQFAYTGKKLISWNM